MKFPVLLLSAAFMFARLISVAQVDNQGARLLGMEQYNQAKSAFKASLKLNTNAVNWFYLGKIYSIQDDADSARYCFGKTAEADPKNILVLVGQAISENLSGNKSQSLLTLEKAQRSAISSRDINAMCEIAEARYLAGDTLKWPLTLNLASGIDKKNPKPYIVGGNLYSVMGDNYSRSQYYGLASGRYRQALYLQPDNPEALSRLAEIDIKILNYEDAETTLFKVIAKDPTYIPALKNLGELMYTLGRYREASEYYGQYIALAETSEKDLVRYITILYFNKEYSRAGEYISKVLLSNPSNPVMLRLKGYTAYELNQNLEGLDAMKKFFAVRSVSDTSKVIATDYEYYGKLLSRTGNDSLAIVNLSKAMEMDTAKAGLLEDIAKLYEKQKKYPEAVRYFEKLIQANDDNVPSLVYFSMGKDLLLMADNTQGTADSLLRPAYLEKANLAFGKVVEMSPGSYLGYQWRARALAGLDPESTQGLAKADYEKALSILESKNDTKKYATELIEAYRYLGYYYYLKYDEIKKSGDAAAKEQARTESMGYWQKVIAIDPSNSVAKKAIAALK